MVEASVFQCQAARGSVLIASSEYSVHSFLHRSHGAEFVSLKPEHNLILCDNQIGRNYSIVYECNLDWRQTKNECSCQALASLLAINWNLLVMSCAKSKIFAIQNRGTPQKLLEFCLLTSFHHFSTYQRSYDTIPMTSILFVMNDVFASNARVYSKQLVADFNWVSSRWINT